MSVLVLYRKVKEFGCWRLPGFLFFVTILVALHALAVARCTSSTQDGSHTHVYIVVVLMTALNHYSYHYNILQ